MFNFNNFNEQQIEAITSDEPYLKVIAGAGSGKTSVLTNRIAYLVRERNVSEKNILAITFTNKAASEMNERVFKLLEREVFLGLITTFHSYCLRVLKEDINVLGYKKDFIIIDNDDQKVLLKQINKKLNYDSDVFNARSIIAYISNYKNKYHPDYLDDYTKKVYHEFYLEYEKRLKANNYLDFDDLIIKCVELFSNNSHILEKWRYRYNYIHVDEFQDTNEIQYELIKLIAKDLNLFIVGDPDQTIYTWRGARIDYIMNFEKDFVPSKVIKLEYNYRSQQSILDCANSLIIKNVNRIDKTLLPTIKASDKVVHFIGDSAIDEANYVIEKIIEIIEKEPDVNYNDFAILYRSNYISRVFEQRLLQANIDYQIVGGQKFFERKEIKDALAYLQLVVHEDDLSLSRIINVPKRKIGEVSLDKINDYASRYHLSNYQVIKDYLNEINLSNTQKQNLSKLVNIIEDLKKLDNVADVVQYIIENVNILEEYSNNNLEYQKREENIQELYNYALTSNKDINDFLQDVILDSSYEDKDGYKVNLMSIHRAKGLEFKYVFVVYLCDGIFPSMYSLDKIDLEEERRLAYVGFTRAREKLFLLSHLYSERFQRMSSSIFIKEIDSEYLEKEGKHAHDKYLKPVVEAMNIFKEKNKNTDVIDYKVNDVVIHPTFKRGVIIKVSDNILTIAFEQKVGIKKIASSFVEKEK